MYYSPYLNRSYYNGMNPFISYGSYYDMQYSNQVLGFMKGSSHSQTDKAKIREIFHGKEFNIEKNDLDMIINSIYEERGRLYVDAYMVNLKDAPISAITNFHLTLTGIDERPFAHKIFDIIDIQGSLRPYEGKRINFSFEPRDYNIDGVDFKGINWEFTYNYE